jgi:hypothetical protein
MLVLKLPVSEQQLAKLEGEGDFAFLAPLAIHGEQKVVHIHIRYRTFYDVIYAASHLDESGQKNLPVVEGARLDVEP